MRDSSKIFYVVLSGILSLILLVSVVLMAIPSTRAKISDKIATNFSPAYAEIKDENTKQSEDITNLNAQVKALNEQIKKLNESAEIKTGLFEVGSNKLIKSWDDLIADGDIVIETTDSSKSLKCVNKDLSGILLCGEVKGLTSLNNAFLECNSLAYIDVSNFDTSNVTDMSSMFASASNTGWTNNYKSCIMGINLGENFNTSKVYNMNSMFEGCSALSSIDLSNFDTSNVITMSCMFKGCNNLKTMDLTKFDTSKVTAIDFMFYYCSKLESIDLSNFDTSNVTNFDHSFAGCSSLTSLDLSNFNTSNVTDMQYLFQGCSSLSQLNISSFDFSIVRNFYFAFDGCSSLTSLDLSGLQFGDLSTLANPRFGYVNCLKLDNQFSLPDSSQIDFFSSFKGEIEFDGTIEQWRAKGITYAKYALNKTTIIHCSDGDIESESLVAGADLVSTFTSDSNYLKLYSDGTALLKYNQDYFRLTIENGTLKENSMIYCNSNFDETTNRYNATVSSVTVAADNTSIIITLTPRRSSEITVTFYDYTKESN